MDEYCPFDLEPDPTVLGLAPFSHETHYGLQVGFKTAEPTSSTVRLLLHGVGGNAQSWTPLLQEYRRAGAPTGDLLVPDLPGFGYSQNIRSALPAADVGRMLLDLARDHGWQEVELVGHSMGGFLALDMAAHQHREVSRLTIVSGAYFSVVDTVNHLWRSLRTNRGTAVSYLSMQTLAALGPVGPALMNGAIAAGLANPLLSGMVADPARLKPGIRHSLLTNLRPRAFSLAAKNGKDYDAHAVWSRVDVPTRALFGREDHLVPPADADRLASAIPKADVEILEGVGHFAHVERPAATRGFIDG